MVRKEISILTPPTEVEQSQVEEPETTEEKEVENPKEEKPKVIDKIVIGDYELI